MTARHVVSDYGWPDERFTPEVIASLVGTEVKFTAPTHDWSKQIGCGVVLDAYLDETGLRITVDAGDRSWAALQGSSEADPLPVSIGFSFSRTGTVRLRLYDISRHSNEPAVPA